MLRHADPPSVWRRWWHTIGEKVKGATLFAFKVRHRAGMTIAHFSSLFRGGRSLHSDPHGKAAELAMKGSWKWKIRGGFSGRHGTLLELLAVAQTAPVLCLATLAD